MTCVVSIVKGQDRDQFIGELQAAGLEFDQVPGLPRHFIVHGVAARDFPLRGSPVVESVDESDESAEPPLSQQITLDAMLSQGSWSIARVIRRDAPWLVDRIQHPVNTYYRSVRDGAGVDLYIIDTGIYVGHQEFGGRASNVYEHTSSGGLGDDNGHGTLVAAAAAGSTVGLARGAEIFSFKSSINAGTGGSTAASVTSCIGQVLLHYADREETDRPAVCNMSIHPGLGGGSLISAVEDMIDAGIVTVLSAGNEIVEMSEAQYPLAYADGIIVVGGSNMADLPYWAATDGTNYGSRVDILAPGLAVLSAAAPVRGVGEYEARRGTSVSAPVVSGVIACMLQGHSRLTGKAQVLAVRDKLLSNATTGRMRTGFGISPLPDRLLYLDPDQAAPEPIFDGL